MLKTKIKYLIEIGFNFNKFFKVKRQRPMIHILLSPQYLNYGDHAIAAAEIKYLMQYFQNWQVDEENYTFYKYWKNLVEKRIQKEDIILITGGGYAGDLWAENQDLLEDVISRFPDNKIILAPQTVFYKKNTEIVSYARFKNILDSHKDVSVIAREQNTFQFLETEFELKPGKNLFKLPDFVLTLQLKYNDKIRQGIGYCLRTDSEKVISDKEWETLKQSLRQENCKEYSICMAKDHMEIPVWLREYFLNKKFREFSERNLIITDRLHGMIFAAITGTPCVAMDNISHKISGVYHDIEKLSYVKIAEKVEDVEKLAAKVTAISYEVRKQQLNLLQNNILKEYMRIFHSLLLDERVEETNGKNKKVY